LLVDSTFTTPYLMRPFEHGADLVFHSATKFLSGHGVVIGGVLVDAGTFRWDEVRRRASSRRSRAVQGFHDMVFSEESTTAAFLLRAATEGIRDFGACMAPFTAFQILQGVETLPLRMERHVANARTIAQFLVDACVRRIGGLPRPAVPS
jgi:O-acetylhomoserine (thiol)-lyase